MPPPPRSPRRPLDTLVGRSQAAKSGAWPSARFGGAAGFASPGRTHQSSGRRIHSLASRISCTSFPGAVIFVTHDRYFLDVIATRIIELADGRCYSHPGNYTAYLESKGHPANRLAEQSERRRQRFPARRTGLGPRGRPGAAVQTAASPRVLLTRSRASKRHRRTGMDLLIPPPPSLGNHAIQLAPRGGEGRRRRPPAMALPRTHSLAQSRANARVSLAATASARPPCLRICLGEPPA